MVVLAQHCTKGCFYHLLCFFIRFNNEACAIENDNPRSIKLSMFFDCRLATKRENGLSLGVNEILAALELLDMLTTPYHFLDVRKQQGS